MTDIQMLTKLAGQGDIEIAKRLTELLDFEARTKQAIEMILNPPPLVDWSREAKR